MFAVIVAVFDVGNDYVKEENKENADSFILNGPLPPDDVRVVALFTSQ